MDDASIDRFDAFSGNYRVNDGRMFGIDRFLLEGSGESTLLISDYRSGVVRRLFPMSLTGFVMGARIQYRIAH
jgi:hypothetical protein